LKIKSLFADFYQPIISSPDCLGQNESPVEFGAKFDINFVDEGFARIEKLSFDLYDENTCLEETKLTLISQFHYFYLLL